MNIAESAVVEAAPERESPFNVVMGIWARWMRLADQQHPGGDANLQDTRDFMRTAEAVNVMVDGLPRVNWWAVKKSQGICTVWRFPDSSYADALQGAEVALVPKMKNHIAVRRYFN
ncbi:hypothetical protein CR152_27830 [Massilia violaceinigra]|uniref:Uncharacterized protein n=1 Tax=Massilia violaceinigra TaxID=2045208 RepID=A0A2D2DSD8_9BURK|nr:hypothetical protein [Massilia violaceinigra]ATQ77887.1 hypothetical protein CR152_27830 [Massilia violaceinigra]